MNAGRRALLVLAALGAVAPGAAAAVRMTAQAPVPSPAAGAAPLPPGTPPPPEAAVPPPAPPAPEPDPGIPASAEVVQEIHGVIAAAMQRFHARDTGGLLSHVSEHYRTGFLTKSILRTKLQTIFGLYDAVQAQVRIDAVRMVGEHAWIFSTGEVSGRVRLLGSWADVIWWDRELEIARREDGVWRLYGYQQ